MPNTINASNKLTSEIHATNNTNPSAPKPIVNLEEIRRLDDGLAGAQATLNDLIGVEDKETYCPDDSVLKTQSFALSEARKLIERLRREALNLPMTNESHSQTKLGLSTDVTTFDIATVWALNRDKDPEALKIQAASRLMETLLQQAHTLRLIATLLAERQTQSEFNKVVDGEILTSWIASSLNQQADISQYASDLLLDLFEGGLAILAKWGKSE